MDGYWLREGVGKQEIGGVDGQTDVSGDATTIQGILMVLQTMDKSVKYTI